MMPTLVLSRRYSEDSNCMFAVANSRKWPVLRAGWAHKREEFGDRVGAIYGETLWARLIAGQAGVKLLEAPLDWLVTVPSELLRRRVYCRFMRNIRSCASRGEPTARFFLKPADDKRFQAKVYEAGTLPNETQARDADVVIASDPLVIREEWRVWILEGRAVSAARYAGESTYGSPWAARLFAQECARSPRTPPALVIDVALLDTGAWACIEANPIFSSGLYPGADIVSVFDAVQAACVLSAPEEFVQPVTLE